MFIESRPTTHTGLEHPNYGQERHLPQGWPTQQQAGITEGTLGLNIATGPAEELDRETEDDRCLTTDISPTD